MASATRRRKTRWTVHAVERISRWVITLGGIGTIAAVSLVGAFLVYVAVPLFQPASIRQGASTQPPAGPSDAPLGFGVDEERLLCWRIDGRGVLRVARLDTGKVLREEALFPGPAPRAAAVSGERAVFGFEDGSIRLCEFRFRPAFLEPEQLAAEARAGLERDALLEHEGGLALRTPAGQLRLTRLETLLGEPVQAAEGAGVALVDASWTSSGAVAATLDTLGRLRLQALRERRNMLTGKVAIRVETAVLPFDPGGRGAPAFLRLAGNGDQVYLGWRDGWIMRFRVFDFDRPLLAEERNLLGGADEELTCFEFLLGKATLLVGDTRGRITAWFPAPVPGRERRGDGFVLVAGHVLQGPPARVTALAASGRSRMAAAGFADGSLQVFHVTSRKRLAAVKVPGGAPVLCAAFAPKDDGLFAAAGGGFHGWSMEPGHPEASLAALFLPVWYEGYPGPRHVWQSTSGTDETEPKLGLVPCIVGTLKATFYSLLFGVPLALLAALYTSEFLHARAKARVKPTIELMASLPSVVLGFLAALVFAPVVEGALPEVLAAFVLLPLALLAGAHLWRLMPRHTALRWARARILFIMLALSVGGLAALVLGPLFERLLFSGDIKAWLDGRVGTGLGGWFLIFIPMTGFVSALAMGRLAGAGLDRAAARAGRLPALLAGKLAAGVLSTLLLALALAWAFTLAGWDPRGSFLGTYVQRNALVVGFVMGFAIIPIIYTIAEDALSSVPAHLRSASLAAGATPWQTAVRVVIPTAMSGLFSSVMIGLGRAVGETMIVLMAAGNTPILDMNIFNGFRTLSANIAVELPEAVQGSTHYRVLFLSALVLFAMTFAVNTLAELVRLRFRRKVVEL